MARLERDGDKRGGLSVSIGFGLAYLAAAELGYYLSLGPSVGGTFWPPAGVTLGVLLSTPRRVWPPLLLAGLLANFVSDQLHGQTLAASVGFGAANLGEPLLGAWLLRRVHGERVTFRRPAQLLGGAVLAVFVSTPLGALVGALTAESFTQSPPGLFRSWSTWWVGDAVGAVLLAPTVVRLLADWRHLGEIGARTWLEVLAYAAALLLVIEVVFDAPPTSVAMPFLVFPVLLWASMRLGLIGVGASLCFVVIATTHHTAAGHGPFASASLSAGERLVSLQVYVGIMAVSFQGLASLWEDRTRVLAALEDARSGLETRYRRLVEQAPLGIVTFFPDGRLKDVNPAWLQLFGEGSPNESGPEAARFALDVRVGLEGAMAGRSSELPEVWVGETDRQTCLRGVAYPVKSETGAIDEIVLMARDVTAERRAEQARETLLEAERVARSEAERASRLKDEFLATLSHELRTPLSAVLGWVHILQRRTPDPPLLSRALSTIERNAKAQARLIEDLLDTSRILAGKLALALAPVPLTTLASAAVDALRPSAETKGVALTLELAEPHATTVNGDSARLQQIVTNLLGNAIKFSSKHGAVRVTVTREEDDVVLSVADDGRGLAPEHVPTVFERFRQGDASTTRTHGGLGLGLSIVKQLVDMHGGAVHAHSEGLGRGATFTVRLPALDPAAAQGRAPRDEAEVDLRGVRVLLVDDELDIREFLGRLLADHGCVVELAGSATDALETLSSFHPDLLVSDIGMPETDGYELVRRVRERSSGRPRAIALTAFARPEDRTRALDAGFDDHVPKPVDPAALMRTMERAVAELCRLDHSGGRIESVLE